MDNLTDEDKYVLRLSLIVFIANQNAIMHDETYPAHSRETAELNKGKAEALKDKIV